MKTKESKVMAAITSMSMMIAAVAFGWAWKTNTQVALMQYQMDEAKKVSYDAQFKALGAEMDKRSARFWKMKAWTVDEMNRIETKVFGGPPTGPNLSESP